MLIKIRFLLLPTLFITLGACTGSARRPEQPVIAVSGELQEMLSQLSPKARLRELDSRAAAASEPNKQAYYQLLGMELLMDYGRANDVRKRLGTFKVRTLDQSHRYRVNLLQAQLALADNKAPLALQKLPKNSPDYPLPIQAGILRTRAIALTKQGYQEESLKLRLQLDEVLQQLLPAKMSDMEDNHQIIWSTLQTMPEDVLRPLQKDDKILRGWVALALAVQSAEEVGVTRDMAIANWQRRYTKHPAAQTLAKTLRSQREFAAVYPKTIGLMLPLSGRYASAAEAIRDGFMASYFNHDVAQRPVIEIYDTGRAGSDIRETYKKALSDGVKLIVGPLQKEDVETITRAGRLSVPVLALNYAPDGVNSKQVVQFGLLPEDEARQAAELAIIKDQTRAIIYAPNTDYGNRLSKAFSDRYVELGGDVLTIEKYSPESNDQGNPIQRSMNILQSKNRKSILSTVIKQNTKFEPHRRQDVEAIFLIASPRSARNFRAQLKFHGAGDISIYSPSQAFSGIVDPKNDRELDGLIFSDIPWTLQGKHNHLFETVEQYWPANLHKYPRLYALGLDAYRIIPYLARLQSNPFERFPGLTGSIVLNNDNRVKRELLWATFADGYPEVMEFTSLEDHELTDDDDDLSYLETP
ncbi:MAG: penicillin-binding protein activator [Gammaproteobacteria bacterium]|nr:penicillin-binding protein activator [Gammaproteobacteria bacterium]